MVWPALIGAAAAIGGSMLASRGGTSKGFAAQQTETQRRQDYERFLENRKYQESAVQRTVADAKSAGVHPLFALGGTAGGGAGAPPFGGGFIPGQSETGSALGRGIQVAGRALAGGVRRYGERGVGAAQLEQVKSQTAVNVALAAKYTSEAKRAELEALNIRPIPELTSAQTWPLGEKPASKLMRRQVVRGSGIGNVVVDPRYPDADWYQQRYGEIADYTYGFPLYLRERYTNNPKSWFNWKRIPRNR